VGARFSAPVQTVPEAHPASCTMGTGSFMGVSCGRGVMLTPYPVLVPRSKIEYSYTSLSLRAFVAYERVKPTYLHNLTCAVPVCKNQGQQEMHVLAYHEVVMTLWTLRNVTHCEISWTGTNFMNHFSSCSNNGQRAYLENRRTVHLVASVSQ
jgi:hypothetical protein